MLSRYCLENNSIVQPRANQLLLPLPTDRNVLNAIHIHSSSPTSQIQSDSSLSHLHLAASSCSHHFAHSQQRPPLLVKSVHKPIEMDNMDESLNDSLMSDDSDVEAVCRGFMEGKSTITSLKPLL